MDQRPCERQPLHHAARQFADRAVARVRHRDGVERGVDVGVVAAVQAGVEGEVLGAAQVGVQRRFVRRIADASPKGAVGRQWRAQSFGALGVGPVESGNDA